MHAHFNFLGISDHHNAASRSKSSLSIDITFSSSFGDCVERLRGPMPSSATIRCQFNPVNISFSEKDSTSHSLHVWGFWGRGTPLSRRRPIPLLGGARGGLQGFEVLSDLLPTPTPPRRGIPAPIPGATLKIHICKPPHSPCNSWSIE
jgi:hypothetical protein